MLLLWVTRFPSGGAWLHGRYPRAEHEQHEQHEDLGILVEATLTLLALMIGFSVSMASNRFYRLGKRKLSATCLAPALTSASCSTPIRTTLDQRRLIA